LCISNTTLFLFVAVVGGYVAGILFPPTELLAPKRIVEFETDYVIKAGARGTSRYFGTSLEPVDLPVEITIGREGFPKLKEVRE
jgi:hypothetical protein